MTVEAVSLFLALMAVVAELAAAAGLILAVGGSIFPALRRLRRRLVETVGPSALSMAAAVAAVCMAGSLYFSEVANFPPCRLCWYQRYAMYPLVPILGFAAWKGLARVRPVGVGLAAIGAIISTHHILVERGVVTESASCDPTNPCSLIWVNRLGYLTIPTMALSGFLLIITLLLVSRAADRWAAGGHPPAGEPSDSHLQRSEAHGHH